MSDQIIWLADRPKKEMRALTQRLNETNEVDADKFVADVRRLGGPNLDYDPAALDELWWWLCKQPIPVRTLTVQQLLTEPLPWWVGPRGGYLPPQRLGGPVLWLLDGLGAYVARVYKQQSPGSELVLAERTKGDPYYNAVLFNVVGGRQTDLIFLVLIDYLVTRFPHRNPRIPDDFERNTGEKVYPPSPARPLSAIFANGLEPPPVDDDDDDEPLTLEEFSDDIARVWIEESLAQDDDIADKAIELITRSPLVESVVHEDRELLLVRLLPGTNNKDAARIVQRASAALRP